MASVERANSDLASITVVPGLTVLNLNILHALDMHMIENAKHTISKLIKKEHTVVANVQKTMIALLKSRIPREKPEARKELEKIVKIMPTNLNALADLETLYRALNRTTDADRCRRKIENILQSTSEEDIQIKRTCLLEQGYATLIERTIINENTVELRITDLHKILTSQVDHSEGNRRECLERGIHHQTQVLRNIHQANEENTADGHLTRKGSSLQKFDLAEKLSSLPLPNPVWNHYHAKALNQYYDSLEKLASTRQDEMTETTIKAIIKFWDFANLPQNGDIKRFKARSFAYIGQILVKQNRKESVQSQADKYDFIRQPEFQSYLNNPLKALKKAYTLMPNDVSVLNRYGRSLWNLAFVTDNSNKRQKIQYLQQADYFLSISIKCDSDRNWFAYSTRMMVRLHLGNTISDQISSEQYLLDALTDGEICFQSQNTRRDMSVLAEVCQKLAKFPDLNRYGPEFVKSKNYLHDALDYLFYATHLGDPIDYYWTNRISSCLFDLGEYEQAIDWQRKTWFMSSPTKSSSFQILSKYMLTRFDRDVKLGETQTRKTFLKEFMYTLVYARERYQDISSHIEQLYRSKRKELFRLFQDVIVDKMLSVNDEEKSVLSDCLDTLINVSKRSKPALFDNLHAEFQRLKQTLNNITPAKKDEYLLSDIFLNTSLKPLSTAIKPWSKGSKYDFFVCHSHKDADWVNNILLKHLEGTFDEYDIPFKGCIADRDFTPGMHVVDNIVEAIAQSNKVILVLTPHFVESNWCHYEANEAINHSLELDQKVNRNFLIPIVLKGCKIPSKLRSYTYVDMTLHEDLMREISRLKKALLPEDK